MSNHLSDVYSDAERAFIRERYHEALRGFASVVAGAPRFMRARIRIADTLLNIGERDRARRVYRALGWHLLRAGQPLLGLLVAKMLTALDPSAVDVLEILAELYSSESDRVAELEIKTEGELPIGQAVPIQVEDAALAAEAERLAAETESIAERPPTLPTIPLFSHLPEPAFIAMLNSLRLRRFADREAIISEGEMGDAFFMLADGEVEVSKLLAGRSTVLARLRPGAVFGEMALVSAEPRVATVRAVGEVALLSLSRLDLEAHAGDLDHVTQALGKFTRSRFLANLAATSPLFQPLSRPDRRALMKLFTPRSVFRGDILIEQGEPGKGLFLVLRGECSVTRAGRSVAMLKSGDVFGEMALLSGAETQATVTVTASGEVLFLPAAAFREVLSAHPELRAALDELTEERLSALRNFGGHRPSVEPARDDARVLV